MTDHSIPGAVLARLMAVIHDRRKHRPPRSYTTQLLDAGPEAIRVKVLEEAGELVASLSAPAREGHDPLHEAADLVYHVLVLVASAGLELADLEQELARRFAFSGLEEKQSRHETPD